MSDQQYVAEVILDIKSAEETIGRLDKRIGNLYSRLQDKPLNLQVNIGKENFGSYAEQAKAKINELTKASALASAAAKAGLRTQSDSFYKSIADDASKALKELASKRTEIERLVGPYTANKWTSTLSGIRENAVGQQETTHARTMQGYLDAYIAKQREAEQATRATTAAQKAQADAQDKAAAAIMSANSQHSKITDAAQNKAAAFIMKANQEQADRFKRLEAEKLAEIQKNSAAVAKALAAEEKQRIKMHQAEMKRKAAEENAAAKAAAKSSGSGGSGRSPLSSRGTLLDRAKIALDFNIAYMAIRKVEDAIRSMAMTAVNAIKTFDELGETQAKMAMWMTFITKGEVSFSEAFKKSRTNVMEFAKASTGAMSTITDLSTAMDEFAQQGVIFGPERMGDLVKFSDFVLMVAQTTGNSARQVRQEVQAIFSGNIRPENQVLRTLKNFGVISKEDLAGLKAGAVSQEFVDKIVSTVADKMDPIYDKMFGSSATRAFGRFYNIILNGYVQLFEEVNKEAGSMNLVADAINKAKDSWNSWGNDRGVSDYRKESIRQLVLVFEDLVSAITAVIKGVEIIAGVVARVVNAAFYAARVVAILSENVTAKQRTTFVEGMDYDPNGYDEMDAAAEKEAREKANRITRAELIAASQRFNGYGITKADSEDMVARMASSKGGAQAFDNRKPEPKVDKKAEGALQRLRDLTESLRDKANNLQEPLDSAGKSADATARKIANLQAALKGTHSKEVKDAWDAYGEETSAAYQKQIEDYATKMRQIIENEGTITRSEIEKTMSFIEDSTSGVNQRLQGPAKTSRLDELKKLTEATDKAGKSSSYRASQMLKEFTDPKAFDYLKQQEALQKRFSDIRKLDVRNEYKEKIDLEEAYQKKKMEAIENGGMEAGLFGAKDGLTAYTREITNSYDNVKSAVARSMTAIEDSMVEAFKNGKLAAGDMFNYIYEAILRLMVQKMIMAPITNAAEGLLSSVPGWFGLSAPTHHTGKAVVGQGSSFTRNVNPGIFGNAPRLHSGLNSDEFPAVLQKGETVQPRGYDPKTVVVIENHSSEKVTPTQERKGSGGERELRILIGDTVKELVTSGSFDPVMAGNYGIRRVGR